MKNASGRITATAMATESAESSLKDCDRLGLGVIGCTVPFRDAYKGTVQKVLKANATAANGKDYEQRSKGQMVKTLRMPCHNSPRVAFSATGTSMPLACM